jgi:AAA domain
MEDIRKVPASGKTGTHQSTSDDQEASDSRLAVHSDTALALDFDLRDFGDPDGFGLSAHHAELRARFDAALSSRCLRDELVDLMFEPVYHMQRTLAGAERGNRREPGCYSADWIKSRAKWSLQFVFKFLADDSGQATEAERAAILAVLDGYLGEFLNDGGIAQALTDFEAEQAAERRQKAIDRLAEVYGRSHFEDDDHDDPLGDAQGPPPAVWGGGSDVLWSAGETLIIEADIGVGKTTLAGQLVRALLFGGEVLGQPVKTLAPGEKVLYLALDRPEQIKRSLARQFTPDQRAALPDRLLVWGRPLPADPAENPNVLRDLAEFHDAAVVVVDSLKDAAVGLSDERVAAAYNGARKQLLATGRELVELHHLTKGLAPYGSVFIPAGPGPSSDYPAGLAASVERSPTGRPQRMSSGRSRSFMTATTARWTYEQRRHRQRGRRPRRTKRPPARRTWWSGSEVMDTRELQLPAPPYTSAAQPSGAMSRRQGAFSTGTRSMVN